MEVLVSLAVHRVLEGGHWRLIQRSFVCGPPLVGSFLLEPRDKFIDRITKNNFLSLKSYDKSDWIISFMLKIVYDVGSLVQD